MISDYGLKYSAWNTLAGRSRLEPGAGGVAPAPIEVDVMTLDAFAETSGAVPRFIKIDAENFEPEVLEGAAGLLESARPSLLLETGSDRAAKLAASLARSGYRAFSTHKAGELSELSDAADAALRYKDVLFAAGETAARILARAGTMAAARTGRAHESVRDR